MLSPVEKGQPSHAHKAGYATLLFLALLFLSPGAATQSDPPDKQEASRTAHKYFNQALEESRRGRHAQAAELYEKAVADSPDYAEAWNNLGNEYRLLERWAEAKAALDRARELEPGSAVVQLNFALLYLAQGKLDPAKESLYQVIKINPSKAAAHFLLGMIDFQQGRTELAGRRFRRALELDPDATPEARVFLARVLAAQGRTAEAVRELEQFLDEHPAHAQAAAARELLARLRAAQADP